MGSQMSTTTTTTTLVMAFVSNVSSREVLICASGDATTFNNTKVGGERTKQTPSVALFKSKLWVAFVSDNDKDEILISSSSDGVNWTPNSKVGQRTKAAPSLCVFNDKLWLAFVADNDKNDILVCSSADGVSWSGNTKVNQTSPMAPSLAVLGDKLFLAFASNHDQYQGQQSDDENRQIRDLLICSSKDGTSWSDNAKIHQTTKCAPSLATFNGKLWMAFVASNDTNDLLVCSSGDGVSWSGNTRVNNESSDSAPSLAAIQDHMYLAFRSNNDKNDLLLCSSSNGTSWTANIKTKQTSRYAPCLFGMVAVRGTVRPRYQVISILYAPPGTAGGKGASSVTYSTSSSAGTTQSISQSIDKGVEVTAKVGDDKSNSAGAGFTYSNTQTDTSTIDVKKTETQTIVVNGPSQDGIDHGYDRFCVCLNPLYTITVTNGTSVQWEMGIDGSAMWVEYLPAYWLDGSVEMPSDMRNKLDQAGLTKDDYAAILALNPFSGGGTTIDTKRFMDTGQGFSYKRPGQPDDLPEQYINKWENTIAVSESHSTQTQYTVTATLTQGMPGILSFKETGSLKITNANTSGKSSSNTQSASFTITGPSYGYNGPSTLQVYWDTIYNTFMFDLHSGPPTYVGNVIDAQGQPVANAPVTLTVGSRTFKTYTDARGDYRFSNTPSGSGTVTVAGQSTPAVSGAQSKIALKVS